MNTQRFVAVLEAIERSPKHWDQTDWHCGTSHCFAGVAQLQEMKMSIKTSAKKLYARTSHRDGLFVYISEVAQRWLGLTDEQSAWLFSSHRTLDDFRRVRQLWCRGG